MTSSDKTTGDKDVPLLIARCVSKGWLLVLSTCVLLVPSSAGAHGAIHEQIAAVTDEINRNPTSAGLYAKRGELHSDHGDWDAALRDFDHAGRLDSSLSIVDLGRGKALFQAGHVASAKEALDRYLVRQPHHTDALVLRARVLAQLGHLAGSATDYTRAIGYLAQLGRPNPDYYFERASVTAAQGRARIPAALRGLDEGMVVLGPLVTLQHYAIELELTAGRTEAALTRLDSLARQQSNRPEAFLARRGQILEQAGRSAEARAAYEQAVAAIDALSPNHRRTRAILELASAVRGALDRLQR
jgi:tetratricopeptide (TPR) repeat protein